MRLGTEWKRLVLERRIRFVIRFTVPIVVLGRIGVARSALARFLPALATIKNLIKQRRRGDGMRVREGSPLVADIFVGLILRMLARPFEEHGVGRPAGAIGHAELPPRLALVVARQLLQGGLDIFPETRIAEVGLRPVFPAGPVGLRLLGNRPARLGPGGEGADPGGVDDREFIDLNLVEGLPLPLVIGARGMFSETDELLPA